MKRVLGEDHREIAPTVGFNIKTLEYNGYLLNLWDVGGQKSIRAYWRNYFEETVIFLRSPTPTPIQMNNHAYMLRATERSGDGKLSLLTRIFCCLLQDGVIWVVDSVDRFRLEECRAQLRDILRQEKLAGSSLLIFANKQDLGGALSLEAISESLGLLDEDISGRHFTICACSAMTGEGLEKGINWLVNDISSRVFVMS